MRLGAPGNTALERSHKKLALISTLLLIHGFIGVPQILHASVSPLFKDSI